MNCSATVARRSFRARRIILLLSTVIGSAFVQPALAQLTPPAPLQPSVDGNGVDLFDGTYVARAPALVLGQVGGPGLSYYKINTGSGWTDNVTAALNQSGNIISVSLGNYTDNFSISGTTFTSTTGDGATLTRSGNIYTYTRSDGTVIHFDYTRSNSTPYFANNGRVTDITNASGLSQTYSYSSIYYCTKSKPGANGSLCTTHGYAYRIATITSTSGYSLTMNYGELDPYDQNDANNGPNFTEYSTVTGVSATNTATGAGVVSQSFSTPSGGGLTVADTVNRTTIYGGSFGVTSVQLPGSSAADITISYTSGRVSAIATAIGTTTYAYSDNGSTNERTVTATDPGSNATAYVFDLTSQLMKRVIDALGHTTITTHDASGRLTQVTHPEGDGVTYTYDGNGNITTTTANAKNGGGSQIVSTALYPCSSTVTCNEPLWTRDALNNETDYAYDPTTGKPTSITSPAAANGVRPQTRYSYTSVGGVSLPTTISQCQTTSSCSGTADEVKTTVGYNANLLPTSVSTGAGDGSLTATTAYTYDAAGDVVTVDGPLPGTADTTTYAYDGGRELISIVGPDPDGSGPLNKRAINYAYLPTGQVAAKTVGSVDSGGRFTALQQLTSTYDAAHRKTQDELDAGGTAYSITQYAYDNLGRLQCTAQRMNPSSWTSQANACQQATSGSFGADRISFTHYDTLSRPDYVTSAYTTPDAATEHLSYSVNGKTASITDANGNVTNYAYDGLDRPLTTTYPDSSYEQQGYDADGNVTSRLLRDGKGTNYGYDALNRLTSISFANPVDVTDSNVTLRYDLMGRLVQAIDAHNHQATYTYDALGRQLSEYGIVALERGYGSDMSYAYDVGGRMTRMTWPDGFYVTYDYDALSEMTAIHENGGLVLASYGYDDLGRRTSITRANGTVTGYAYDSASRLTQLTHYHDASRSVQDLGITMSYNSSGQIISRSLSNDAFAWTGATNADRSYAVNGLNQYTQSGGATLSYDGRGDLITSGSLTYTYNSKNQMATTSGPTATQFYYDPLGRLDQIWATGTEFDSAGSHIASEWDGSGGSVAMLRRYVYGPGSDEPVVWYEGSGTSDRRFLETDERGSVVSVDDASGNILARNSYDEYGIPGPSNMGRFQYTGQAWLPELGMYYYKARMYSPTLGRFMQTDPIGYGDGVNWYNYVGGDPINSYDSSGLDEDQDVVVTGHRPPLAEPSLPPIVVLPPGSFQPIGLPDILGKLGDGAGDGEGAVPADIVVTAIRPKVSPQSVAGQINDVVVTARRTARVTVDALNQTFTTIDQTFDLIRDILIPPACCFTAGTLVTTPSGLKAIETLKVGDLVMSRNDKTGETAAKPIVSITPAHERRIWTVTVSYKDGNGRWLDERYETTDDHPWRAAGGRWVTSAALKHGEVLARQHGTGIVSAAIDTGATKLTYNLEIAEFHTYFVGKAETWVHNSCDDIIVIGKRTFTRDRSFGFQMGQPVYVYGRTAISRDITEHRGPAYKLFSVQGSRLVRLGTYSVDLSERLGN